MVRHGGHNSDSTATTTTETTSAAGSSVCGSPSITSTVAVKSPECGTKRGGQHLTTPRGGGKSHLPHETIKISVSYPSSDAISSEATANSNNNNGGLPSSPSPNSSKKSSFSSNSSPPSSQLYAVHYTANGREAAGAALYRNRDPNCHLRVTGQRLASHLNRRCSIGVGRRRSSDTSTLATGAPEDAGGGKDLSPSPTFDDGAGGNNSKPKLISRMGKRNIKAQVKRFRMETKAAKTLGIIVGGFIVCWLPFFTMYLLRAFCESCIHPLVFSVLFWLGYCNSAINPCIYALFSKDFRFAFKRIICRCFCGRKLRHSGGQSGGLGRGGRRRGSDGSQLGTRLGVGLDRGRSPSYNNCTVDGGNGNRNPHSIGEDSDPGIEGSDSR